MKNYIINKLSKAARAILGVLVVSSCVDDSATEIVLPSTSLIQIVDESPTIFEDESVAVAVTFIEPAQESGTINISFTGDAVYGTDFVTDPEGTAEGVSVPVAQGADELSVSFSGINRSGTVEVSKTVNLDFSSSGGVSFGNNTTTSVTIDNRPEIEVIGSLTDFGSVLELESSTSQNFMVAGIGLTGDLEINAPDNFEISLDDADFDTVATIAAADLMADTSTVYVRFSPAFDALGAQTGSVAFESDDANEVLVAANGTGTEQPPTIEVNLSDVNFGSAPTDAVTGSTELTVTGYRLTGEVTVTTAAPFEVSLDGNSYLTSITLDQNAINPEDGEVSFHARFAPTSGVDGDKMGTITLSSDGATNQVINASGTEGLSVIASTSFEEPTASTNAYVDTGDPATSVNRPLGNNANEPTVQFTSTGGELGFSTTYSFNGNTTGMTDGGFVGVTSETAWVSTSPEGGYTDGTQGFRFTDVDGLIRVTFDEVDISGLSTIRVQADYILESSGYETADFIALIIQVPSTGEERLILGLNGDDIDNGLLDPDPPVWYNIDEDISDLAGEPSIRIILQVNVDGGTEGVYFDNIQIAGG